MFSRYYWDDSGIAGIWSHAVDPPCPLLSAVSPSRLAKFVNYKSLSQTSKTHQKKLWQDVVPSEVVLLSR